MPDPIQPTNPEVAMPENSSDLEVWGRIKDENGSRSRSNLTDGRLFFD